MATFRRRFDRTGENPRAGTGRNPNLPMFPTEFAALVEVAGNHIKAQEEEHTASWGLGTAERVDFDLELGTITWVLPERNMLATAPAELLATWDPQDQTLLSGWDHPLAPPGSAVASQVTKDWADRYGVTELQQRSIECEMGECYSIAGVASLIGNLQGVYELDAGGQWAYMGFGTVRLQPLDPT